MPKRTCGWFLAATMLVACGSDPIVGPERAEISIGPSTPIIQPGENDEAETTAGTIREATTQRSTATKERLLIYRNLDGAIDDEPTDGADDPLNQKTLQLNFANAPIADVTRAVIAEALGRPVSIAEGVSGNITLTAPEPTSARAALEALEQTLGASNLSLIETPTGFLLTSLSDASETTVDVAGRAAIGYGLTFVPVEYASASEIIQLIDPFISDRIAATAAGSDTLIALRGPQVDIAAALEAIAVFDEPILTDRVFGLFEIRFADAETIAGDVETILNELQSDSGVQTNFTPLPRLNQLLVIARTQQAFDEAKSWIERFDRPSGGDERRLRYYKIQNTPADILAAQLSAAFGGSSSVGSGATIGRNAGRSSRPTDTSARRTIGSTSSGSTPGTSQSLGGSSDRSTSTSVVRSPSPSTLSTGTDSLRIVIDELNNALLIRATDREYAEILDLVEKMDVPPAQVLIEAVIAEVTLTEDLSFGVRWFWENAESQIVFSGNETAGVAPILPGFNYSYVDANVDVALNALASVTDVSILSAPSIMVLNNQTANLQVGDEVPIVTQQAQGVIDANAPIVSTLQLRDTGVILEVTPQINASDMVVLEVSQEVSDVTQTTTSGIDSPTIQQRRFTSAVAVRDNATIALGGLIRETYTDNDSGVPVLRDIPLLGEAFKSRSLNKRRTELIVFLTPQIVRNDTDASEAIKRLKRDMQNLSKAFNLDGS
ncbi:MAG: type II secretion system secretin GspD [Pseudomonadota bacterium]